MIYVVELPEQAEPRAWFAFDVSDLLRKLAAADAPSLRRTFERIGPCEPAVLAESALRARGECRIWWDESEALAAFESTDEPAWQGAGWRARWALREQLVALDVLADDL